MNVTIYGTGYVGLVQGVVLADAGYDVLCVDVDAEKISALQQGIITIHEPGLESLLLQGLGQKKLQFSTDFAQGVIHGEFQIIAVGTPSDEDGSADLQHVFAVVEKIADYIVNYCVIVIKSTVPVGTCDTVQQKIKEMLDFRQLMTSFDVVSNPEFLKEGSAVSDCQRPDRIIIGVCSSLAEKRLRAFYAPFNRNHDKIIVMDPRSAELTKYASNGLLATKISFMNEMANLAEMLGADIEAVRQGMGGDPRIGHHFIYPGVGYGGSCFPKDMRSLIHTANVVGYNAQLLQAVETRNILQKQILLNKINKHFDGALQSKRFAMWGLAFKPNTNDIREAPSRVMIEALVKAGSIIQAYDPAAMTDARKIYGGYPQVILVSSKEQALENADALIIATEWKIFRSPDFGLMKQLLKQPVIFDGRNLYSPAEMCELGFVYYCVGRMYLNTSCL